MSANIQDFTPLDTPEQIDALANLLPFGEIWRAKNIPDSNVYRLLKAFSKEFSRMSASQYALASEFIPSKFMGFIEEWERFLGIPDGCLTTDVPDEIRRLNIIAKLGYLNLFTEQDYRDLAELYGLEVVSFDNSVFGVIEITISTGGLPPDNTFDMDFDTNLDPEGAFIFGVLEEAFYSCLVQTYAPAFVQVIINTV
jgi:uncharacterized protein YmfQ (DUF2313 family)